VPFGYIPRNQFNEKASPSGARMGNPPDSLNCCYIAITLIDRSAGIIRPEESA